MLMADFFISEEEQLFVRQNIDKDVTALALSLGRYSSLDNLKVLRQISGYQTLKKKLPSWFEVDGLLMPESLSLEQCSSEQTARYKYKFLKSVFGSSQGLCMVDITGGFGVDFAFMSELFEKAYYVERNSDLCKITGENLKTLGYKNVFTSNCDGYEFLIKYSGTFDLIFIDPARRDIKGSKVVLLSDCEPDILKLKETLFEKSEYILVKMSPMLDISLALNQLPETTHVHVVSLGGECKELLFLLRKGYCENNPLYNCVNILGDGSQQILSYFKDEDKDGVFVFTDEVSEYIYEPNASVMKAGGFAVIAGKYSLKKFHANSHLFTSENYYADFQGRVFEVEQVLPYKTKLIKSFTGKSFKANITVRNFPDSVAVIREKTGIREGGDCYIFATTLSDERKILIFCSKK